VTSISATPPTFSSVDSSVNFTAASCNFLRGNLSDTYSNNATVFAVASVTPTPELSAGVVTTFAGNGTGSYVNGTGTNATFQFPAGVTVDGSETVYVIDTWNHRIRRITPLGVVSLLAGSGTPAFADGTGAGASFAYPGTGVTDNAGNLYVVDGNNQRIRRIVISTGVVTTLAGNGTASSVNGTGGSATFNAPAGIAISLDRTRLAVTELFGNRVRQIVISTAVVTTLAGSGTGASTDGIGTAAAFFNPLPITNDPFGNLYVGDPSSHRIRKINIASTVVTTFAGSSLGTANGTGTNAQFNYP
jgi:sugar lactone lactonase YvrE